MATIRKYKNFRNIFFAVLLCFSIMPVLVTGIAIPAQFSALYTENKLQEIEKFVRNKGEVIDLFFEERLGQLKSIGEMYSWDTLTTPGKLSGLLRILKANAQTIVDLGVIDMQGQHVIYAGPYDVGAANYADEDWFIATKRQGAHVSDVFLGFRQSPHIALAVLCGDDKQSWILRATINASMLTYIVQANRTVEKGDVFILNKGGRLQTDSSLYGQALKLMDPAWPGHHAAITMQKINGNPYVVATTPLRKVPWLLAYVETAGSFNKVLAKTFFIAAGGFLLSLLVLGLGAWFLVHKVLKTFLDADEKKAIYLDSILQANKIAGMEKFTEGIVAEMNEPIALLRETGYRLTHLLEDENPDSMKHHREMLDAVNLVETETNRGADILCRLLAFAQKLNPFWESVPLHTLVDQAIAFLEQEVVAFQTEIIREFGQPEIRVFTDASQLQQVLIHVLENAIDAAGKYGTILISSDTAKGQARIHVKDNGPGIPEEKLVRIFDPLYTKKNGNDTSRLGLVICRAIMEKLGGTIKAASSLEEGTIFTITLPLVPPDSLG